MNNLKSIYFFVFSTTLFFSVNGISVIRKKKTIVDDLITKSDFEFYLNSLEKLVYFYTRHKFYVAWNPAFGLFMVDVNLRSHLQNKQCDIPVEIRSRLENILLKIDVLSDFFHYKVQQIKDGGTKYSRIAKLSELFYNQTTWARAPDKFNKGLLKRKMIYSQAELKEIYGEWEDYVNDTRKPTNSDDECLEMLASNVPSEPPEQCRIPPHCKIRVGEGTDVGFSVSARVFLLIAARFSRQCFVFSESEDKYELDDYCTKYFHEVQYIAFNDFKLPIVASHHCAVCGICGHAQFFKKFWLKKLTQFQTSKGCFSDLILAETYKESLEEETREVKVEWKITNQSILAGECDPHFSSASLMTLSNALRYILETYFYTQ